MNRLTLLLALLVAACVPGMAGLSPGSQRPLVVASADYCPLRSCEQWAPFARAGDPPTDQVYWLVSETGWACEVTHVAAASVSPGDLVQCAWRPPRR